MFCRVIESMVLRSVARRFQALDHKQCSGMHRVCLPWQRTKVLILTLVCSNGLGHYRRCIEILSRIQQTKPEAEFLVCCEAWQIERMQDWALSENSGPEERRPFTA